MKQNGRTINSYFIFIILLVMVIVGLNLLSNREEDYTRAEFIADLDAGNVSEIVIQPNGEAPTGYLEIQMKNGLNHKLYATDITELETLVREYGFDPVVNDIERENWFLTAAKGGLKMLTKNICSEYGQYNIQCNGLGPGYIETPQTAPLREIQPDGSRHPFDQFICAKTPANRWLKPEELTGPAVFLASEASNAVNGHILYVDGGILAYIGKQPQ